ncbi:type III secretion protein [Pseudomonas floridensis]|uniref:Type III secretion protein n=1 Tax=Pseudomonas floridensis TaxID=1958950 RepID=A0A1X0N6A1_9PSED|nr:type III secretion protein [Pseudomonas floridensis]ORC59103.1 type III secretion protein [Pseudomonas floridensis]
MINFKSLQNNLDNTLTNALSDVDDALGSGNGPISADDIDAFSEASQQAAVASNVADQCQQAGYKLTKNVIDGFQ